MFSFNIDYYTTKLLVLSRIKSAIELGEMADKHKANYDEYKKRVKYFTEILNGYAV
jgi:hypothetical protein